MGSFAEELLKTLTQEVIKKGFDKWSQHKPKVDVCVNCPTCGKALKATMRSIEKDKLHCPGCQTDLNRDAMREQAHKYLAILNVEIQALCKTCGKVATITPELGASYKCTDCNTPFLYEELYALTRK
jgi:uncharacterized Zn finger protein